MMIYVIPKDDDKPIKIVFEGGKGSNPIIEDDRVYFIDEHPSPEEVGKAFRTLYERLMSIEEVFEKQIPKKPIKEGCYYLCPCCGRALDWSEVKKMSDYIDRDELIKHVKDLPTWWEDGGGVYGPPMKYPEGLFYPEDVIASIENAPAADVQKIKHGKWMKDDSDGCYCSVCKWYADYDYDYVTNNGLGNDDFNYCSHCGAKMDGGN